MHEHFTWLSWLPRLLHSVSASYADTEKLILAILLGLVILMMSKAAVRRIGAPAGFNKDNSLIPEARLSLFTFFDVLIDIFVKYQDSILGKHNRKYLPLTGTTFVFVLFANFLGLIPGFAAITTSVWINLGMAVVVFCAFNYYGVRENGLVGYLKHFCGPIWWIAWMVLPLELLSTFMRVLTLNLRLYWNISADHIVLGIFTNLTKLFIPVLFYGLGAFVSFMQAFVFTTLTMVYILLATQHEEGHEGHDEQH